MMKSPLTHERLLFLLNYNPETGIFTRKVAPDSRAKVAVGTVAGNENNGYWIVGIDNVQYRAGRLAWFYVHGKWPVGVIDHKDRRKLNNAIDNLEDTTQRHNTCNTARQDRELPLGVHTSHGGRFVALARNKYLGTFSTPEEASAAYQATYASIA